MAADPPRPGADTGFTVVEMMVSIAVIGVIMLSLTSFFVRSMAVVAHQRTEQAAILVANGAVELMKALPGHSLADRRSQATTTQQWATPVPGVAAYLAASEMAFDASPGAGTPALPFGDAVTAPVKLNGVGYLRHWYLGRCWQSALDGVCDRTAVAGDVPFFRVVVAVTWTERSCAADLCSYVTATLVSTQSDDALFNINEEAKPPSTANVAAQTSTVSQPVSLQLAAAGGTAPLTWSGTGLPDGLTIAPDGLISGTPTRTGSYTVTARVADAFGLSDTVAFTWTVVAPVAPLTLTNPGDQSTASGAAVSLSFTAGGGQAPLVWNAGGLPAGLTVNTSTGTISGTTSTAGSYPVTVTVTDQRGTSRSVSFTWTVTAPPAPSTNLYQGVVLADGPLGYWRLGETGGPTATDSSGNGWHGGYLGAPVFGRTGALTGNTDTSVSLGGTNAGVSAPDRNDFTGTAPFSVEAWVRPQNLGASSDYKTIVRKYGTGGGYWFWVNSIEGFGFQRVSGTSSSKVAVGPSTTGVWLHLVATYDGTTVRLYVNGSLRGSAGSPFPLSDTTATVDIGIHSTVSANSMNGDLDDVAIYGTALSAARVAAHYQKGVNG